MARQLIFRVPAVFRMLAWLCAIGGLACLASAPAIAQREHTFAGSFGGPGSGAGQLSSPGAIAVNDASGDVYVLDRGNGRVEQFSSSGAYIGQFNGSAAPTGAFSWAGENLGEPAIAVDNSTDPLDPSAGDVYVSDVGHRVVDKFSATGTYLGQVTGTPTGPFKDVSGVATDTNGALWIEDLVGLQSAVGRIISEYSDGSTNEFVTEAHMRFPFRDEAATERAYLSRQTGFALDSHGDFYVGQTNFSESESVFVAKFDSGGTPLAEEVGGEEAATGMAVDRSSDDVYIDNEASVTAFDPNGAFVERFGAGSMDASSGIAVNASTGTVYASAAGSETIDVFTASVVPDVATGLVSHLAETSAALTGVVNPDGLPTSSCVFEYGRTSSYGQTAPCSPSPGSGSEPVEVSAAISGLERLTRYHFRLKASNANGTIAGRDRSFLTPVPVVVGEQEVTDVSSGAAQFSARVNPGGADTTFRFEFGPTAAYGEDIPMPDGDLGPGTGSEPVSVRAEGLQPETTYHVRIAATNVLGTVYGPDVTFTTQAAGGLFALPDGRRWEMVSPPSKYGASIEPLTFEGYVEAALDGTAITYLADGPIVESSAANPAPFHTTQVLSSRSAAGWSTQDIVSPDSTVDKPTNTEGTSEFKFFSSDLSSSLVEPVGDTLLAPGITEQTVYRRDNGTGEYLPLVTGANVPPETKISGQFPEERVHGAVATPDMAHVIIESTAKLTSDAKQLGLSEGKELYEWTGGRLVLVSALENGEPSKGALGGDSGRNIRHALSSDGSRVFWEWDGALYLRDTVAGRTTRVDVPEAGVPTPPAWKAQFEAASAMGSSVFFLDEEPLTADSKLRTVNAGESTGIKDLYVYDAGAKTIADLTVDRGGSEPARVQDVLLGASEDGSIVYFVATGVLAVGAQSGRDNLYVVSRNGSEWSAPRFIATLSAEDAPTWGQVPGQAELLHNGPASTVSPNGRFLAFMSNSSLTGYDNRDASSGRRDEEVFLYDEASNVLSCASCNRTGTRPSGIAEPAPGEEGCCEPLSDRAEAWRGQSLAADTPTWDDTRGSPERWPYQSRYLSDEGRLFFNGFDSLVAQDTNGRADVYEYEPDRVGNCGSASGCVSLISSGTSADESAFLDASGTGPGNHEGEDVFFVTKSRLTSQDFDAGFDVYDAHVCSSASPCNAAPVAPPACVSGDACKAAPSPQPEIFGPAPSATFSGAGNIVQAPKPMAKGRSLPRARRLARALQACRKKRSRHRRALCERNARKRFGAPSRKANTTKKGNR